LVGRLVLFGYTWALMNHMLGGIRHFIWDTGRGYELKTIDLLSWGTLVASVILTVLIWLAVLASG
jgi:succinate dehydrogenase / fumarate reductase cytochrome b subunit